MTCSSTDNTASLHEPLASTWTALTKDNPCCIFKSLAAVVPRLSMLGQSRVWEGFAGDRFTTSLFCSMNKILFTLVCCTEAFSTEPIQILSGHWQAARSGPQLDADIEACMAARLASECLLTCNRNRCSLFSHVPLAFSLKQFGLEALNKQVLNPSQTTLC